MPRAPGCCPPRRSRWRRPPARRRPRRRCRPTTRPGCACATTGCGCARTPRPLVNGHWPSSQQLVLPTMTAPAARNRRTTSASSVAGRMRPAAPERGRHACDVDVVLDRDRDAQQGSGLAGRTPAVGLGRVGQRVLGEHQPEGVERRLTDGDGMQRPPDQFAGGHRAAGQLVQLLAEGRKPGGPARIDVHSHCELETNGAGPRGCRIAVGNWCDAAVPGPGGRAAPAQAR